MVDHAEGCKVYATDGREYLDFTCGIGVTNTGHCHPKVVEAIRKQAGELLHGQVNILISKPVVELINELPSIVPSHLDGYFFSNSGAEAVEGAVKLAKHATGRPNVIVFQGSFHGRTALTMQLTTSKTGYRAGYAPLPSGVFVAPYPYAYRYGWDEETTVKFCLEELDLLLISQTAPSETAAVLVEPVLGEGGYVVPPKSFLQGLRERCDRYGMLLIADEIQSGFGRTGKWFAHEWFDLKPDIMTVAKGIASGLPLSGVFAPINLMKKWAVGSHGGTYGGNPVAAASAVATIQVIKEEHLLENANARGRQLMDCLRNIQKQDPVIGDVRGLGLMIATEFRTPDRQPDKVTAKAVVKSCEERGLLLLTCGPFDNVIRWIPPLMVSPEEIDQAVEIFKQAMDSV